jgi:hypothetical protein
MLMTSKQADGIRNNIIRIKSLLAADKRRWGGYYDDSLGLRYLPPKLYIQIADYTGGLNYTKWFSKNFPDDVCTPDFLFEWTIILFKSGKIKDAEKKAFESFCSNAYIFDKYFGRPIIPIDKYENSNMETTFFTEKFDYSSNQTELVDFTDWLKHYIIQETFIMATSKYIEIYKRLKTEQDREKRGYLLKLAKQIIDEF